ncbi:MAG: alanine dehydrogenase [Gammaproteobacteria bacterium]
MKIGIIREIKNRENRVALTPGGVTHLLANGHRVLIEQGAGEGSGFSDQDYASAGAALVSTTQAWESDLVVKVKEPLPDEYNYLQGQMVFTFFHLAGVDPQLTHHLLDSGTTAIAYESVEDDQGRLPLLAPMSAVAGSMAVTMGNYYLAAFNQGRGVLLSRLLGEQHGKVVIIGDGVVGQHAGRVAAGLGAEVVMMGVSPSAESVLKMQVSADIRYVLSSPDSVQHEIETADLVVGAVLLRNAKAPHVITQAMVKTMPAGSVIVDVSIDQGGCVETSRPTSHSDPVFTQHGVLHYCVTNMPGAYPRTSTLALTSATLAYILQLANDGVDTLQDSSGLARGINTWRGGLTCKPVAEALGMLDRYREFAPE